MAAMSPTLPTIRPEWLEAVSVSSHGCICESRNCRACREWRIGIDALLCSAAGLEIAAYTDSLIDTWSDAGPDECFEQVESHIQSAYPDVNPLLVELVLEQARGHIYSQEMGGCGRARSAKAAAAYIRSFVARRRAS